MAIELPEEEDRGQSAPLLHKAIAAHPKKRLLVRLKNAYMRGEQFDENGWREFLGLPKVDDPDIFARDQKRSYEFRNRLGEMSPPSNKELEKFLAEIRSRGTEEKADQDDEGPVSLPAGGEEEEASSGTSYVADEQAQRIKDLEARLAELEGEVPDTGDLSGVPTPDWGIRKLRAYAAEHGLRPVAPRTPRVEAYEQVLEDGLARNLFTSAEASEAASPVVD